MPRRLLKNKSDIETWLERKHIQNYRIDNDLTVNVDDHVTIVSNNKTHYLPVNFGVVSGDFNVIGLGLKSLAGAPHTVGGYAALGNNYLTSLEFCPKNIGTSLYIASNLLTRLEFCPKIIHEDFHCGGNPLESFDFGPELVRGAYCFQSNETLKNLTTLKTKIMGDFVCDNTVFEELKNYYHSWGACTLPASTGIIQSIVEKNLLEDNLTQQNSLENKKQFKV